MMRRGGSSVLKLRVLVLIACVGSIISAKAQVPLASLLQPNATLQSGDKLFSDFFYTGSPIPATDILITPTADIFGPGLLITGVAPNTISAGPGQFSQFNLGFSVTVLDPNLFISDVHLAFNANVTGDGLATVTESVFVGSGTTQIGVFANTNSAVTSATAFIVPPVKTLDFVLKDVIVNGGQNGSAQILSITQTFSQIPEPSAFALVGLSLLIVSLMRRR